MRRVKRAEDVPPEFQGNPKTHGIDTPRGGGFSIMQNLQKDLREEEEKERKKARTMKARDWWKDVLNDVQGHLSFGDYDLAGKGLEKLESSFKNAYGFHKIIRQIKNLIKSKENLDKMAESLSEALYRFERDVEKGQREARIANKVAMYWCGPGRHYRRTRGEQNNGVALCPHCREEMDLQKFTRSEKLYCCPECGFKIPSGKVVDERLVNEIVAKIASKQIGETENGF